VRANGRYRPRPAGLNLDLYIEITATARVDSAHRGATLRYKWVRCRRARCSKGGTVLSSEEFQSRLDAVRTAYADVAESDEDVYLNGQLPLNSDDVSQWDNYDRYFKFYN